MRRKEMKKMAVLLSACMLMGNSVTAMAEIQMDAAESEATATGTESVPTGK